MVNARLCEPARLGVFLFFLDLNYTCIPVYSDVPFLVEVLIFYLSTTDFHLQMIQVLR